MTTKAMSYVIGCDSFLSLRNVRNGDLGRRLDGLRVYVDPAQLQGSALAAPEGVSIESLLDFDVGKDRDLHRLMNAAYEARKAYYDGWTLWSKHRGRVDRGPGSSGIRRAVGLGAQTVRFARAWLEGASGRTPKWRKQCSTRLRQHPLVAEYHRRFAGIDPGVVGGFSPEGTREMLLIEAANAAGVPTFVMVRSRDNIVSKIRHLPQAHLYFVWSDVVREFLTRLYPEIDPRRILVTGSPQFDRHLNPAFRLDRQAFFDRVGLDSSRPLIVYTMATPGLIDHEIDIVQHLADAARSGRFVRRAQLLVRGHPRMFGSNLRLLREESADARSYPPPANADYRSARHESDVVRLILEDEPVHLGTLACQDVQVNVCGTMTIDSAILDKPTVNVYYDLVRDVPFGRSVRRFYERTDVRQMMSYGASRLARDPEECIRLINQYLDQPQLDAQGRQRARDEDCGPLDGRAGERLAAAIRELAPDPQPSLIQEK